MGTREKNDTAPLAPVERIAQTILFIRDQKVMLDADLAALYGVDTKVFVQAVKRNMDRFPEDFMFQLTKQEYDNLRSQIVTSSWGGRRYPPAFFPICGFQNHSPLEGVVEKSGHGSERVRLV